MANILLLEDPHTIADTTFEKYGCQVRRIPSSLGEEELLTELADVDIVGLRSKTHITRKVIESAPRLAAIGAFCIGTNQIDLSAASEAGIAVFNAPYSNTRSVVEMAISEIIALIRHLPARNKVLQRGTWEKSAAGAHEVRGKTLGIIGYGSIGSQLSVLAEAVGMRVLFYDIVEKLAIGNARRVNSLDELLANSDAVSLHIDGRESNAGFFSRELFAKMKPGAVFINLARGHVVDLEALQEGLESGAISGAGIDVYPSEPAANGEEFHTKLQKFDNIILTPHIGGSTMEAQKSIGGFVSEKLMQYWQRGETHMSVNLPNLAPSPGVDSLYRIGWVHRNTPGALARVNQLFANEGINITYQSLATRGPYGYIVMDTTAEISPTVIDELQSSPAHIRLRILKQQNEN